jgi:hypothetical protein
MATTEIAAASPRTAPAARVVLWLLSWFLAAALVLGGAYSLLDVGARHTFTVRLAYVGVRSLVVVDDTGNVALTGAPAGGAVVVSERVTQGLSTPRREAVRGSGGVLRLSASCRALLSPECNVSYEIAVPSDIAVAASSGEGDVSARDLVSTARVDLSSGAGDVSAGGVSAPDVRLSSGAGDVQADLLGNLRRLEASSGAGDVSLTVPNAVYHVTATSGAGGVSDQGLRQDPASPRVIIATSGAGDVTIHAAR